MSRFNDGVTEVQAISTKDLNGKNIVLFNIYVPPASGCPRGYDPSPNFESILGSTTEDCLVCGDFNAHDPLWDSLLSDTRGSGLAEALDNTTLCSQYT